MKVILTGVKWYNKARVNRIEKIQWDGGDLVCKSCPTLATTWTAACQASLSMGFSRQEY